METKTVGRPIIIWSTKSSVDWPFCSAVITQRLGLPARDTYGPGSQSQIASLWSNCALRVIFLYLAPVREGHPSHTVEGAGGKTIGGRSRIVLLIARFHGQIAFIVRALPLPSPGGHIPSPGCLRHVPGSVQRSLCNKRPTVPSNNTTSVGNLDYCNTVVIRPQCTNITNITAPSH